MSAAKLQRVLWRLRTKYPDKTFYHNRDLQRCIMLECGTDQETVRNNRKALIMLKWILVRNSQSLSITGLDLQES